MQEFPPPPESEPEETNSDENQEELGVSEIVEKINNKEKITGEEEEKLRTEIQNTICEEKPEEEWTAEEREAQSAYSKGIKEDLFEERRERSATLDFDLESIKYNRSSREEKEKTVENRIKDAQAGLAGTEEEIIMSEYQDLEKREEKKNELKNELERIIDEKMEIYKEINEEEIVTADIFSEEGREKLKKAINVLKESDQALLNLRRFEYYSFASDELESLIEKSHIEKDFEIRGLEKMSKSYDGIMELLNKKEGKEEELTPEERSIRKKMQQWMEDHPRATLAIAILALAAIAGVAWHFGGPVLMAKWGAEKVMEEAIVAEVAKGSAAGKGVAWMGYLGKGAAYVGAGAGIAGKAGILGWLATIKQKNIDRAMSVLTGVNIAPMEDNKQKS